MYVSMYEYVYVCVCMYVRTYVRMHIWLQIFLEKDNVYRVIRLTYTYVGNRSRKQFIRSPLLRMQHFFFFFYIC